MRTSISFRVEVADERGPIATRAYLIAKSCMAGK